MFMLKSYYYIYNMEPEPNERQNFGTDVIKISGVPAFNIQQAKYGVLFSAPLLFMLLLSLDHYI